MRFFSRWKWLGVLLFASQTFAFPVSVKSSTTASQVFIGDRFEYQIEVNAPESALVELPAFVGNLGNFEVKDLLRDEDGEKSLPGQKKSIWKATLNTFVAGDFLIAPQEVQAVLGSDTVIVKTDPVAIKVVSRTDGSEEDILEVEEPIDDSQMPLWTRILLGILGALLFVALGWFLHRKLRSEKSFRMLPPYEEAVLALKKLRESQLLASGNQAEYFTSLSFIVRRYLERRFLDGCSAEGILDATLSQLKSRIAHIPGLPEAYKQSLVELEKETYPVKFAKMKIGEDRVVFWEDWANRLVEDTKPVPEKKKLGTEGAANGSR